MSLLIKALDKAEAEKAQAKSANKKSQDKLSQVAKSTEDNVNAPLAASDVGAELSLSPPDTSLADAPMLDLDVLPSSMQASAAAILQKEVVVSGKTNPAQTSQASNNLASASQPYTLAEAQTANASPAQAAKVFSAKRIEATHQNTKLALLAGASLITMLAMGVYFYQFVDDSPPLVVPPRPVAMAPSPAAAPPVIQAEASEPINESAPDEEASPMAEAPETTQLFAQKPAEKMARAQAGRAVSSEEAVTDETETMEDANQLIVATGKSKPVKLDKAIASESASIQVSQSKPQDAVNPMVMRAYEAYNAGNDSEAQKLYKQVLYRDSNNIDAMLGLAAIATRQERFADAGGWYNKVLELEPKNAAAQAGLLSTQQNSDPQSAERRIKSLLAKTPGDADLNAALGNLYAEQNQWQAAQQAYFEAFRYSQTAENAYNLAVSLDQMGKPKLALPYYRQVLDLTQSGDVGIDINALKARIEAIQ